MFDGTTRKKVEKVNLQSQMKEMQLESLDMFKARDQARKDLQKRFDEANAKLDKERLHSLE